MTETHRLQMNESSTQKQDVTHATLVFERELPAPAARVFSAYADARVRAAWSAPSNDIIIYDQDEFSEGCQDRFRCGPKANPNIQGTTQYWEIVPNQRIVSTETLTMGGTRLAVSLNTIEFAEFGNSTKLKHTIQIVSLIGQDMVQGYEHGNNAALSGLARYLASVNP
jgi:uncharacterized protein YndB with AHSA1/START domain